MAGIRIMGLFVNLATATFGVFYHLLLGRCSWLKAPDCGMSIYPLSSLIFRLWVLRGVTRGIEDHYLEEIRTGRDQASSDTNNRTTRYLDNFDRDGTYAFKTY
jgi:hypothetical protein